MLSWWITAAQTTICGADGSEISHLWRAVLHPCPTHDQPWLLLIFSRTCTRCSCTKSYVPFQCWFRVSQVRRDVDRVLWRKRRVKTKRENESPTRLRGVINLWNDNVLSCSRRRGINSGDARIKLSTAPTWCWEMRSWEFEPLVLEKLRISPREIRLKCDRQKEPTRKEKNWNIALIHKKRRVLNRRGLREEVTSSIYLLPITVAS